MKNEHQQQLNRRTNRRKQTWSKNKWKMQQFNNERPLERRTHTQTHIFLLLQRLFTAQWSFDRFSFMITLCRNAVYMMPSDFDCVVCVWMWNVKCSMFRSIKQKGHQQFVTLLIENVFSILVKFIVAERYSRNLTEFRWLILVEVNVCVSLYTFGVLFLHITESNFVDCCYAWWFHLTTKLSLFVVCC